MSYINKRIRAFNEGPADEVVNIRSEGRMKNYPSAIDIRAWSDTVEERRQHILEYMSKNKKGMCPDKLIPLDVLIDAMMAQKNDRIRKLEKRIQYLEKLLDIYSQLNLTPEQKNKLDELKKDLEEAYAELDSLKSERDELDTVYDRRKRKSDEYPGGKPKKRDKKRASQRAESEGAGSTKRAQRKKKARVPAREMPETSGDEEISAPKKIKGKRKADKKKDRSLPEMLTTDLDEADGVSKKNKPLKKKTVPSDYDPESERKDATGGKRKSLSEPSEEQVLKKETRTSQPINRKKPISDTEYELHPEKGQEKKRLGYRKEKTDVTTKPRTETSMKGKPKSGEKISNEQKGVVKQAPLSQKMEKPSTGAKISKDTKDHPQQVGTDKETSKDRKPSKSRRVSESIKSKPKEFPTERTETPSEGAPESEEEIKQVSALSIRNRPVQDKATKAKAGKTKAAESSDVKANPKSTAQKKNKVSGEEMPEEKIKEKAEIAPIDQFTKTKPQPTMGIGEKPRQKQMGYDESATPQRGEGTEEEVPNKKPAEVTKTAEEPAKVKKKPVDERTQKVQEKIPVNEVMEKVTLDKKGKKDKPKSLISDEDEKKLVGIEKDRKSDMKDSTKSPDESMKKKSEKKSLLEPGVIDEDMDISADQKDIRYMDKKSTGKSETSEVQKSPKKVELEPVQAKKVPENVTGSNITEKEPKEINKTTQKKPLKVKLEDRVPETKKLSEIPDMQEKVTPEVGNVELDQKSWERSNKSPKMGEDAPIKDGKNDPINKSLIKDGESLKMSKAPKEKDVKVNVESTVKTKKNGKSVGIKENGPEEPLKEKHIRDVQIESAKDKPTTNVMLEKNTKTPKEGTETDGDPNKGKSTKTLESKGQMKRDKKPEIRENVSETLDEEGEPNIVEPEGPKKAESKPIRNEKPKFAKEKNVPMKEKPMKTVESEEQTKKDQKPGADEKILKPLTDEKVSKIIKSAEPKTEKEKQLIAGEPTSKKGNVVPKNEQPMEAIESEKRNKKDQKREADEKISESLADEGVSKIVQSEKHKTESKRKPLAAGETLSGKEKIDARKEKPIETIKSEKQTKKDGKPEAEVKIKPSSDGGLSKIVESRDPETEKEKQITAEETVSAKEIDAGKEKPIEDIESEDQTKKYGKSEAEAKIKPISDNRVSKIVESEKTKPEERNQLTDGEPESGKRSGPDQAEPIKAIGLGKKTEKVKEPEARAKLSNTIIDGEVSKIDEPEKPKKEEREQFTGVQPKSAMKDFLSKKGKSIKPAESDEKTEKDEKLEAKDKVSKILTDEGVYETVESGKSETEARKQSTSGKPKSAKEQIVPRKEKPITVESDSKMKKEEKPEAKDELPKILVDEGVSQITESEEPETEERKQLFRVAEPESVEEKVVDEKDREVALAVTKLKGPEETQIDTDKKQEEPSSVIKKPQEAFSIEEILPKTIETVEKLSEERQKQKQTQAIQDEVEKQKLTRKTETETEVITDEQKLLSIPEKNMVETGKVSVTDDGIPGEIEKTIDDIKGGPKDEKFKMKTKETEELPGVLFGDVVHEDESVSEDIQETEKDIDNLKKIAEEADKFFKGIKSKIPKKKMKQKSIDEGDKKAEDTEIQLVPYEDTDEDMELIESGPGEKESSDISDTNIVPFETKEGIEISGESKKFPEAKHEKKLTKESVPEEAQIDEGTLGVESSDQGKGEMEALKEFKKMKDEDEHVEAGKSVEYEKGRRESLTNIKEPTTTDSEGKPVIGEQVDQIKMAESKPLKTDELSKKEEGFDKGKEFMEDKKGKYDFLRLTGEPIDEGSKEVLEKPKGISSEVKPTVEPGESRLPGRREGKLEQRKISSESGKHIKPEECNIPDDGLHELIEADQLKKGEDGRSREKKESQQDVQGRQLEYRCAALIRHAKERCAAMASRSGGIVALPDPKRGEQDLIPTGYWHGEVLPELLLPQPTTRVPDWVKQGGTNLERNLPQISEDKETNIVGQISSQTGIDKDIMSRSDLPRQAELDQKQKSQTIAQSVPVTTGELSASQIDTPFSGYQGNVSFVTDGINKLTASSRYSTDQRDPEYFISRSTEKLNKHELGAYLKDKNTAFSEIQSESVGYAQSKKDQSKVCRAICSIPIEEKPSISAISKISSEKQHYHLRESPIQDVPGLVDYSSDLSPDDDTPRKQEFVEEKHISEEDTRQLNDERRKYIPKLELTWEEIDFEESTIDKFDGEALLGSRISRVLLGDSSGLGTARIPIAHTGSKTLSGEILQRRLSENVLLKKSSEMKEHKYSGVSSSKLLEEKPIKTDKKRPCLCSVLMTSHLISSRESPENEVTEADLRQTRTETKSTIIENEEVLPPSEETKIREITPPEPKLQLQDVIAISTPGETMEIDVAEHKPVIKLFERDINLDQVVTSEEQIHESIADGVRAQLEDVLESLDEIAMKEDSDVAEKLISQGPEDIEQSMSLRIQEDESQYQDLDRIELKHSQNVVATVAQISEQDEFVSAIDTSRTKDENLVEETPEQKASLPPEQYDVKRSEERIDIPSVITNPIVEAEVEEPQFVKQITPVSKVPAAHEPISETHIVEEKITVVQIPVADDVQKEEPQNIEENISRASITTVDEIHNVQDATKIEQIPVEDDQEEELREIELDTSRASIIVEEIDVVEKATTIAQTPLENAQEESHELHESVIFVDIVDEIFDKVNKTTARETSIIKEDMMPPNSYVIAMQDFNESFMQNMPEEDSNEGLGIYHDNLIPRSSRIKGPLELAKLQIDESIVQDNSSRKIGENFVPRATLETTKYIMEEMSDKVIFGKEVLTPGEVNKIMDDQLLPLPIVLHSPVLPTVSKQTATQQVPMGALPQVVPEVFKTVPRAVMTEYLPRPVPVSTGFLPCLFGTERSTTCGTKKDSLSQTVDQLKHVKNIETVFPETGLVCSCCKNMAAKQMVCKGICTTIESEPRRNICNGPSAKPAKDNNCKRSGTGRDLEDKQMVCKGICATIESEPKKNAKDKSSGTKRDLEDKQDFNRNQDALERRMIIVTPKDSEEGFPTLIIHKDAEIIALRNALTAKESYCAEQRKIATAALEQLENIKNIVEERDDLRKKLESSQDELEELKRNIALGYPFGISENQPSMPPSVGGSQSTTCEEEIAALENEINDMRGGKLTPDLEAQVIRKEVEVLKKYCSKLSVIQKENHQLKNQIAKYEDKLNKLGCLEDEDQIRELKNKLDTLNDTVKERDELKCKCNKLENELMSYIDLPEDIEVFKQRSLLLDEVLQDRDRLSKRVEQLRGIDEELYNLRKKSTRVDELEGNLKRVSQDKRFQDEELEHLRCKCSFAEIEALNQKAEGDTLKSKIACLEHEVESMKCICKDKERLKQERDELKKNLDELVRMQNNFDHMKNQIKCMDMLKKERDVYKCKYENLIGLECECDILRAQVERAKGIEKERDALENQVEDLETCIADQENEIRRLVCHIDILARGRDEQQDKLKDVLCAMRAELEKKDNIIKLSEEKLSLVQKELITSIQGLSSETTNLKSKNDTLEKCMCNLEKDKKTLETEKNNLENCLSDLQREKRVSDQEKINLENCLCNLEIAAKTSTEEISLMKVQITNMKKRAEDLDRQMRELKSDNEFLIDKLQKQEIYIKSLQDVLKDHEPMLKNLELLKQTARDDSAKYELEATKLQEQQQKSLTGDDHLHDLLKQSKHAVQRIALELCKQYEEWDCVKNKLKQIRKDDQSRGRNRVCICCTCICTCGCKSSVLENRSTQNRSGDDKGITVKIMDSSGTQDDGVVVDNKAISVKGLENAGTQYPKKQGIASDDHTKWDCYNKKNKKKELKKSVCNDSKYVMTSARLPCDCKSIGVTTEECKKWECQAMNGLGKTDKNIGEVCECVSTGTDCYPDICSSLRGQYTAKLIVPDKPCDCMKKIQNSNKRDNKYEKIGETLLDPSPEGKEEKRDGMQEGEERVAMKPTYEFDIFKWSCKAKLNTDLNGDEKIDEISQDQSPDAPEINNDDAYKYEYDISKWSCKTTIKADPKNDQQEFDVSKWSCREPKAGEHKIEDETEDEMHTARSNEDKCKHLEERIEVLEKELAQANETIMKLQEKLTATDGTIAENLALRRHSSEVQEVAKDQIEDLVEHLKKAKERVALLEGENVKLNDLLKNLQLEKDEFMKLINSLQRESQKSTSSTDVLSKLRKELDDCLKEKSALQERIAMLEKQLSDEVPEDEKLRDLLKTNKNLEERLKNEMDLRQQLEGHNEVLEKRIAELEKLLPKEDLGQNELDDLKKKLQDAEDNLKKEAEERLRSQNRLEELLKAGGGGFDQLLQKELDELRKKLLEAENSIKKEIEARQQAENKISEMLKAYDGGDSDERKELEELRNKLKDAEKNLKREIDERHEAENKYEELLNAGDSDLDKLRQKEIDDLRKKLQEAENKISDSDKLKQNELEELRKKLKNVEENLKREMEARQKSDEKIAELLKAGDGSDLDKMRQKELDDLRKKLQDAENEISDSNKLKQNELEELRKKLKDAEENLEREIKARQKSDGKIAELLKAGDSSDLDKVRQKELEELRKKLQDAENKLKSTGDMSEVDQLKKELDNEKNKSKNLDDLMSQIQKLKKEKDDLEKMLASNVMTTSRRSSKMENDLQLLDKKNQELEEENKRLKKFENDSKDLMQKLTTCKDENKQLKDDLEKAKSDLEKLKKQQPDSGIVDALKKENENLLKKLEAQAREIADLLDKMKIPKPVVELSKSQLDKEQKEKQALQSIITDLENQLKNLSRDDKKVQPIIPSDDLQKMIKYLTKRLEDEQKRADSAELALRNMRTSDPSAMLNAEIAKLKKQLAELEVENTKLKQQLAQSNNEAAKFKKDLNTLMNELKMKNEEIDQLKQQLSKSQNENSELKSSMDKLKSGLSGDDFLKSEVKRLNDQISQLEKERTSIKNEVVQKDNEIKNAYDKISKLQAEIGELKQNQVKLQSENDKLKKELDSALNNAKKDTARIAQLENENGKLRKDIQNLEGEIAKTKRELDSALNAAKKGTTGVSDLQDEITKLKQTILQLESENANMKRDLNAALDNSKNTAAKLAQLTIENETLKNAKDAAEDKLMKLQKNLEAANAEAKKAVSDLGRQQNEMASLKDKLAKIEVENGKLKKDLTSALDDAKKGTGLMDEDAKLKSKLAQLENENSKLKKDLEKALEEAKKASGLDKLKDEDNKLREKLMKLEADNVKLKKDLSAALDNANKASATISQLQDDQNKLKQKLSSVENENSQLKKDVNKALDDAKKYASEISALRDNESKLKQRIAQLESENAKLKKDLDASSVSDKNNLNMIQSLIDENNKMKQKIAQLEQENSKLRKDQEAALKDQKIPASVEDSEKWKIKVSQLEDGNKILKKELDNVIDDHKKCPKMISQLQDEIERLKRQIAELEKDGSKWKNQYEGAMGDMKMNKDELNKLTESESKLKQLLAQAQIDNSKLNKDITVLTAELQTTSTNLSLAKDEAARAKQRIGLLEADNSQLKKNLDGTLEDMKKNQRLLSQLQEETPKLKQRIALLETENAKLKKHLDAALADAKKGSAGADQMKSEDSKLRDLLAQLEKENKKLKGDINNALDQAKKSVADVTKMRDDDSKQKQQIAKLDNENAKLRKDLEKALNDALANSSGAQGLRDENNKLKQRISQLEGEIAKLKSDLNAALENAKKGASGLSEMQADDAKLKQRITQLEKDNVKLKGDLEAALKEARAGTDTGSKLRNENAKQKQMIGQLEDEIAKLKKNLENALNDSKKGDSGLSNLQDENAKLKQKISQLEKDNTMLKKSLDDALANAKTVSSANLQLTDENSKLKQKVKQLEGDLDKLRKELNTALDDKKKAIANLSDAKDNEVKLKQKLAELESANRKLKQDLDSASGDAKSGKSDLNRLIDENASIKKRIALLEGENAKLKKDLDGALSDSKNKSGEIQRLKDENAKLKQKIADLETGNVKMKKYLDSAVADSRNTAGELAKLKDEIAKLKLAIAQKDKKLDDTRDKDSRIEELTNENDKLKGKIRELENQVSKLNDDLAKFKRESAQKDGQINDLKKNLDKARANNKEKDAKIKDLQNKLMQEGSLDDSLAKLRQEMGLSNDQVNDLKNRLEKSMSENNNKDAKIKEIVDENEKLKGRLKDLENQMEKANEALKTANNMAKKASEDLSKMRGDYEKLKADNETLMKSMPDTDKTKEYEVKIKQLQAELANQMKECTDNIASMKEQFDREMKDLLKKNDASIAKLQKAHEEFLKELNERHDRDIKSLQDALKKAKGELDEITKERDRLKALLDGQRRKSLEIRDKVEQVESIVKKERKKSREESQKSKLLEDKLDAEIKKSKDLESTSFMLKKSIEEQKRKSEELAKEKQAVVEKTSKLEKEKDNLERSSIKMQRTFEEEKRKSNDLARDLEILKKTVSEIPLSVVKKEERESEPVPIKKSIEPLVMQTFKTFSIDASMPDVIAISMPLSDKELKFFGKTSCSCEPNLDSVLEKLGKFGWDALGIEELQLLHTKVSDVTANVLAKIGQSSGVLKPNENDKLGLLRRIASLEGDLLKKQKHAQQKVIAMQYAVKLEKERLGDLRRSLDEEKLKNSELLSQIGSQSKVVSNIQEERDLIQRQKSYHEQKLEQYLVAVEEERGKSRNLEDELEKEKSNNLHLKSLLETERSRSRQNKRKDTESLEAMRIKLEKTVNSEMMLRMKLQEKTFHRQPSPHSTPVRDSQQSSNPRQSSSRTRTAFYTDLSPGDGKSRTCTKRTFSSSSQNGGHSGSSNGLDLEDK